MASMYSDSLRAFLKPIVPFLDDATVNEIVINGPNEIWVERAGRISKTTARFSEEGLLAAARNIAQFVGRTLTEERPRLDARLPDGSRIHIILPPIGRNGTVVAIRKFMRETLTMDRLVSLGTATPAVAALLEAIMQLRLNVIVSGGTGSGKTSLLNVLSSFVDTHERIVTIEDSAELALQQEGVISLEARQVDKNGKGEVTLSDLLNSALRLRPDRIIVGEVRGGECLYLLQAMNTGHSGSMATTHANSPVGTLRRLESLSLMSGVELPLVAVRAQVASAVNIVVCTERLGDGTRKITCISEVLPLDEHGEYRVQDLFCYTPTGRDATTGTIEGVFAPTGVVPTFFTRLHGAGIDLPETFFDPASHGLHQPLVFTAGAGEQTNWAGSIEARLAGEAPPDVVPWIPKATVAKPSPAVTAPTAARPAAPPPAPPPVVAAPKPAPVAPKPAPAPRGDEPRIQVDPELWEDAKESAPEDRTNPRGRS